MATEKVKVLAQGGAYYVDESGEKHRSPPETAVSFILPFSNGEELECDFRRIPGFDVNAIPAGPCRQGLANGLRQTVGDAFAGAAKADPTDPVGWAVETARGRIEALEEGRYLTRESGLGMPRTTLLMEAVVRAAAADGIEMDTAKAKELVSKMSDDVRKNIVKDPSVHAGIFAAYAAIQAERAAERASKAREAAESESGAKVSLW